LNSTPDVRLEDMRMDMDWTNRALSNAMPRTL